ncbi:hypothetical protein [Zophobihabitans entericus]|uniref:Immunity protein 43 domain-containing protein n=1 Tax=Zophobihabitans entericus TaxID=1635327 RepID=A0A6G9IB36_9GAMM|nr:hypothetical protein [Zophobihabitans entericus]QIQ21433.1 hypothetical protein IPMB12_06880 [Zophobihabitans entericus]
MYYYLSSDYSDKNFFDADFNFQPPLEGYYDIGEPIVPLSKDRLLNIRFKPHVKIMDMDFAIVFDVILISDEFANILKNFKSDTVLIPTDCKYSNNKPVKKKFWLLHSLSRQGCFDYNNSDYGGKELILKSYQEGNPKLVKVPKSIAIDCNNTNEFDYFFLKNVIFLYPIISENLKNALENAKLKIEAHSTLSILPQHK